MLDFLLTIGHGKASCHAKGKEGKKAREVGKETEEGRETWIDIGNASGVIKILMNGLDT